MLGLQLETVFVVVCRIDDVGSFMFPPLGAMDVVALLAHITYKSSPALHPVRATLVVFKPVLFQTAAVSVNPNLVQTCWVPRLNLFDILYTASSQKVIVTAAVSTWYLKSIEAYAFSALPKYWPTTVVPSETVLAEVAKLKYSGPLILPV